MRHLRLLSTYCCWARCTMRCLGPSWGQAGCKLGAGWGQAEGKHPLYELPSWDLQPALHSSFLPAQ